MEKHCILGYKSWFLDTLQTTIKYTFEVFPYINFALYM